VYVATRAEVLLLGLAVAPVCVLFIIWYSGVIIMFLFVQDCSLFHSPTVPPTGIHPHEHESSRS